MNQHQRIFAALLIVLAVVLLVSVQNASAQGLIGAPRNACAYGGRSYSNADDKTTDDKTTDELKVQPAGATQLFAEEDALLQYIHGSDKPSGIVPMLVRLDQRLGVASFYLGIAFGFAITRISRKAAIKALLEGGASLRSARAYLRKRLLVAVGVSAIVPIACMINFVAGLLGGVTCR
jgi:hypothetical protein